MRHTSPVSPRRLNGTAGSSYISPPTCPRDGVHRNPQGRASLLHILEILFRQYRLHDLCYGTRAQGQQVAETMDDPFVLGPLSAYGRDLAVELVTLAKAGALAALGEQNAGIRLVEEWLRASDF